MAVKGLHILLKGILLFILLLVLFIPGVYSLNWVRGTTFFDGLYCELAGCDIVGDVTIAKDFNVSGNSIFKDNVTFSEDIIVDKVVYTPSVVNPNSPVDFPSGISGEASGLWNLSNISNIDGDIVIEGNLNMTNNSIIEYRGSPVPDYDSGWLDIGQGEFKELFHNVGGDADDYRVSVLAKNDDGTEINNLYMGLDKDGVNIRGFYYLSLNATEIWVYRAPNDVRAEQVRARIWVMV